MLVIRHEQNQKLDNTQLERFVAEAIEFIQDIWTEESAAMDSIELRSLVMESIEESSKFKLEQEEHVFRFINIKLSLGNNFFYSEDYPWAKKILINDELSPTDKIDALDELTAKALKNQ